MNGFLKAFFLIALIAYVVSPVDLCPGPIDDAIMILLYAAGKKALPSGEN